MIRREANNQYHLITQHDHALLSGHLASHLSNAHFAPPEPFDIVIQAISLHDCGWPDHDNRPTLNPDGRPTDVFESPLQVSLPVWSNSVDRARRHDPYIALLVSLHVLGLSALPPAANQAVGTAGGRTPRDTFELNKFQHRQIELQETLRHELGLRTDQPLTLGVNPDSHDPRELALVRNLRLLQAMDLLSLAACCTHPPAEKSVPFSPRLGHPPVSLNVTRAGNDLLVHPWPFDASILPCRIAARAVEARPWEDLDAFHEAYHHAPVLSIPFVVRQST